MSRCSQAEAMPNKVAYLGPPGTFTEEAGILHDSAAELLPFSSVFAVASAVEAGTADEGVVAIENSIEGSVNDTLDLLIHQSKLLIRKELVLPITLCLMAKPGTRKEQVNLIYSHPNPLGQSRKFIERCFPKAEVVAAMSTIAAVEEMKGLDRPAAAIAPRRAAELYGVDILAQGIQDQATNVTRFVVLAAEDHPPTGDDKTSISFTFAEDKPAQLHGVISAFAARDINLAKIESRPAKGRLGEYVFLIDLQGHRLDRKVAETLREVEGKTSTLKVFGSYPRFRYQAPEGDGGKL